MYSNLAYEIVNSSISKIKENVDSEPEDKNISRLPKNELIIEEFEDDKEGHSVVVDMNKKSTAEILKPMDFEIVNSSASISQVNENDVADEENVSKNEEIIDQYNKYNQPSTCWCGQSFKHERNLQRHVITVHEGRRDFPCKVCMNDFTSKQVLKRHVEGKHKMKMCLTCLQCLSDIGKKHALKNITSSL